MINIGPTTDIEYVDNIFLHIHHSGGMTSINMKPSEALAFCKFLKTVKCKEQVEMKYKSFTFLSEDFDEGGTNILLDHGKTRVVLRIELYQIPKIIHDITDSLVSDAETKGG